MSGLIVNMKRDLGFHDAQKHNLGIVEPDPNGDLWSYVQLGEAIAVGRAVVDWHAVNGGTVTRAQGVGTNRLQDTGEFDDADDIYIEGAIGLIAGHANGQGQAFYVKRRIDDDELEVEVIGDEDGWVAPGNGWTEALTTSSQYTIIAPGVVKYPARGTDHAVFPRGVAQHAGTVGQFGWVKMTGLGLVRKDGDGNATGFGRDLALSNAGGLDGSVEGFTPGTNHPHEIIAQDPFGDVAGTGAQVVFAQINIVNHLRSYRLVDTEHVYNRNTIQ